MKGKLLIIGASGHGKVVADIALKMDKWETIDFLDDNLSVKSSMGINVIGKSMEFINYIDDYDMFVGIGDNKVRKRIYKKLIEANASIPLLLHPSAVIGEQVHIENGTVVMAGVVINCCTKIGVGCIINTSSTIDHDNIIGDFIHISPGAHLAGNVYVDDESWLGIGSVISNNIGIYKECIIGAGSVVINDIKETGTYVGIPAIKID